MITARVTRLVRVPDLRAMHDAIADAAVSSDPLEARGCAVIVPTHAAAAALRATLERRLLGEHAPILVLPDLLTRDDLYTAFYHALPQAPALLSRFEREVLMRRAARAAAGRGAAPPFQLRPGLIAEMLSFYDELRRQGRTVADFHRLLTEPLAASAGFDRGAERMLRQTAFLVHAFTAFEAGMEATGGLDEHRLRTHLLDYLEQPPFTRIVLAVADRIADPHGLWSEDYDLLARLTGLRRLDVVATEHVLASGFHQRLHDLLPGTLEERREPSGRPVLIAPPADPQGAAPAWFVSRDREEELATVARAIAHSPGIDRVGIVYQRRLPYLYLAHHVLRDAGLPYEAHDALPLASEPYAAALDLVLTFLTAEGNRASLCELLGSPHWRFTAGGDESPISPGDVAVADVLLRERRYFGGWDRLHALAEELGRAPAESSREARRFRRAAMVLATARRVAERLGEVAAAPAASAQLRALLQFIRDHERPSPADDEWHAAEARARAAVLGVIEGLAEAHARHDDEPLDVSELVGTLRRWVEGQTFAPRTGSGGVRLLDAAAAAFADIDEAWIVGLVESDWPDRSGRNIFYPPSLLTPLSWPGERDRLGASRARFRDLLELARRRVSLSTFLLEGDSLVAASNFLEELTTTPLVVERASRAPDVRFFQHEALSEDPVVADALDGAPAEWLRMRLARSPLEDPRFHGAAGERAATTYAVSHLERYLECPFKYFASHVLRLEEERDAQSGLTPRERGQVVHEAFQAFFARWHADGHRAITVENLPRALELFEDVAEARLVQLSETDRALERTHLLGSAVSSGLAIRAFAFEIEHGVEVLERLLEHPLEGDFGFAGADGERRVSIRAKADRIDLLEDGTLRVLDYKLGRAPRPSRALQLPVYGACAVQHLEGRLGRSWSVSRAGYIAFRERNTFMPLGGSGSLEEALLAGQRRLVATVDAIERGEFPPQPEDPFLCAWCGYAGVCRKDYVGDE